MYSTGYFAILLLPYLKRIPLPPIPDKELAPSNFPHSAVRQGQSGTPQFPTLALSFVKNSFY